MPSPALFIALRRRLAPAVVALLPALVACVGNIGSPDGTTGTPTPPGSTPSSCTGAQLAPMRRLSRAEYLATVRDLFPGLTLDDLAIGRDPTDHGFENRADLLNPQPLLIEQYNTAAAEIAVRVIEDPGALVPCDPASTGDVATTCAADFLSAFGTRAFRRPLTADESATYHAFIAAELAAGSGLLGAIQLTIEALLQAPQFLYRLELGAPDPATPGLARLTSYEVATRMSYLLWGSTPDDTLLEAAAADRLADPAEREQEARRMLADPRARHMLVEFHRQWLDFDALSNDAKDAATYPTYDAALEAAIREESNRFVAAVMFEGDGTVRSLLTSTTTEVNAPLAELYGVSAPDDEWAAVDLDPGERAGILTRASFLASRAHQVAGSPPLRAVFVYERFLCQTPAAPPADADLSEPAAASGTEGKTNRQLFEERLSPAACKGCHATFTDLGYAFESYDAIGAHRTEDNGQPVDATGAFVNGDIDWEIAGPIDLSEKLAASVEVERCVTHHWFEYAAGRAIEDADACRVDALAAAFAAAGGDVRELLVALVTEPAFAVRPEVTP
jgi:hypothetical protein